jgi:hypothetical protein
MSIDAVLISNDSGGLIKKTKSANYSLASIGKQTSINMSEVIKKCVKKVKTSCGSLDIASEDDQTKDSSKTNSKTSSLLKELKDPNRRPSLEPALSIERRKSLCLEPRKNPVDTSKSAPSSPTSSKVGWATVN